MILKLSKENWILSVIKGAYEDKLARYLQNVDTEVTDVEQACNIMTNAVKETQKIPAIRNYKEKLSHTTIELLN